ncbi:MAG: riboflavin biosynthesis protein RibD, partial [Clostridia bacterium]
DLVDEVHAYVAPLLIGGSEALPSLGGRGRARLDQALKLIDVSWEIAGRDLRVYGRTPRRFLGD